MCKAPQNLDFNRNRNYSTLLQYGQSACFPFGDRELERDLVQALLEDRDRYASVGPADAVVVVAADLVVVILRHPGIPAPRAAVFQP